MDPKKVIRQVKELDNRLNDYVNSLGFLRLRELIREKVDVCNHYKTHEPFKRAQIDHFSFHATRYVGYRFNIR